MWTSNDGEAEHQIERSLGYFGGRVELYQVHNLVAVERRLDALHRLKDEGRVRAVGATHYSRAAFGDVASVMRSGRVDFEQVPYNAAHAQEERAKQVIRVLHAGAAEMAWSTRYEVDYGLRWDHERQVWVGEDEFAYAMPRAGSRYGA